MDLNTIFTFPKRTFYGWWIVVGAAFGLAVYSGLFFYGMPLFFAPLVKEFRVSRGLLSGAFSLSRLEHGIMGPLTGLLVDRFGPRKLMFTGVLIMAFGFVLLGHVSSVTEFYLVFVLLIAIGADMGFSTPLYTAVGNWFVRKRGTAFGIAASGAGLGGFLVPLLGWLIAQFGWRIGAQTVGIAIAAIGIPIALIMRHKPEQYGYVADGKAAPAETEKNWKAIEEVSFSAGEALSTPAFWLVSLTFSIRLMVTGAVSVHIMPYLLDTGFNNETAVFALGLIAVLSIAGRIGYGWLGDHIQKRYLIAGLMGFMGVSLLVLGYVTNLGYLAIFLALYAPAYGGLAVLMQAIRGEYFGREAFGTIMGFMSLVIMVGTVTGPLFAGIIWDITGSYLFAFLIFSAASFVAGGIIIGVKPPRKKERRSSKPAESTI